MNRTPKHIGIIPDGNRRWAVEHGFNKASGYEFGLFSGLRLLRMAKKRNIKEITFYGFTVDNCKRPKEQFVAFSKACCEAVKMIENENVSLLVLGNAKSKCFPKELQPYTERKSPTKNQLKVNFLVNYGWEWDMKNGWVSKVIPPIDLVIRWGGMRRLSGFLPLHTVYADICVIDDLWPDFREEHFTEALQWYSRQDVTLGG